jgi:hypothetical protein
MARKVKKPEPKLIFRVEVHIGSAAELKEFLVEHDLISPERELDHILGGLELSDVDGSRYGGGFDYDTICEGIEED